MPIPKGIDVIINKALLFIIILDNNSLSQVKLTAKTKKLTC